MYVIIITSKSNSEHVSNILYNAKPGRRKVFGKLNVIRQYFTQLKIFNLGVN